MSIFIDTGVFYAARNKADQYHGQAQAILRRIFQKQYGEAFVSDYVVDEVVTLTHARTKDRKKSVQMLDECTNSPELFSILNVDEAEFKQAAQYYRRFAELSFTDCTTMTLMKKHGIDRIATFDSGFKRTGQIEVIEQ